MSTDSRTGSASTDSSPAGLPDPIRNTTVYGPRGAIFDSPVSSSRDNGIFDLLDADHDGHISPAEYIRSRPVNSSRSAGQDSAVAEIPGNSIGNEAAGRRTADFQQLDRDHDGYLSPAELAAGKDDIAGATQR